MAIFVAIDLILGAGMATHGPNGTEFKFDPCADFAFAREGLARAPAGLMAVPT
jgi:hypothetical protein